MSILKFMFVEIKNIFRNKVFSRLNRFDFKLSLRSTSASNSKFSQKQLYITYYVISNIRTTTSKKQWDHNLLTVPLKQLKTNHLMFGPHRRHCLHLGHASDGSGAASATDRRCPALRGLSLWLLPLPGTQHPDATAGLRASELKSWTKKLGFIWFYGFLWQSCCINRNLSSFLVVFSDVLEFEFLEVLSVTAVVLLGSATFQQSFHLQSAHSVTRFWKLWLKPSLGGSPACGFCASNQSAHFWSSLLMKHESEYWGYFMSYADKIYMLYHVILTISEPNDYQLKPTFNHKRLVQFASRHVLWVHIFWLSSTVMCFLLISHATSFAVLSAYLDGMQCPGGDPTLNMMPFDAISIFCFWIF